MDRQTTINAFLQRYAEDWAQGRALTIEEYSRFYPGHERIVREQYLLVSGDTPDPESTVTNSTKTNTSETWGRRGRTDADGENAGEPSVHTGIGMRFGPYLLLEELGRGGQGEVWLAEDERIGRKVALKTLTMVGRLSSRGFERLQLEARVSSRMSHAGICTVFEADQIEGVPFVAMQFIEGASLGTLIRRGRAELPPRESLSLPASGRDQVQRLVAFFETTALALQHAHERGVLHRDIKPGNILVDPKGQPVLVDFGLAHDLESEEGSVSEGLSGTPAYLAPERLAVSAPNTDARVDIYGLGVALFESLCLKRPFEGATRELLFRSIIEHDAPDLRRLNKHVSRDLAVVVATAMAREPDQRYESAQALAEDLAAVRQHRPIVARPPSATRRLRLWIGRHPSLALVGSLLLMASLTATSLGGFLAASWSDIRTGHETILKESSQDWIELGYGELSELRRGSARDAFDEALALVPTDVLARAGLALAYISEGEAEAALTVLDGYQDDLSPELQWVRAEAHRWNGDWESAEAIEAQIPAPQLGREHFLLGTLELFRGHQGRSESFPVAVEHLLQALLQPSPSYAFYYVALADALSHAPSDAWTLRLAKAMLQGWPDHYGVQLLAGKTLQAVDQDAGVAIYRHALELNPHGVAAARNLARFASVDPNPQALVEALAAARAACENDGDFAKLARLRAQLAEARGDFEAANEDFWLAHELSPDKEQHVAELLGFVGRHEGPEAAMDLAQDLLSGEEVLSGEEAMVGARLHIAEQLFNRGAIDEALESLLVVRDESPWTGKMHHLLGLIHAAEGSFEEAAEDFERAQQCRPSEVTLMSLYQSRLELGQLDGLAAACQQLVQDGYPRAERLAQVVSTVEGFLKDGIPTYSPTNLGTAVQLESAAWALELEGRMEQAQFAWARAAAGKKPPVSPAGSIWWRTGRAAILAAGEEALSADRARGTLVATFERHERAWREGIATDRSLGELLRRFKIEP
ncbi:MAG: serine/threonine protein kinase, partial [Planctomycetota bacterium]